MISVIITILKIVFILGFLVLIHESGHFLVAKLCKVKVNEFAIGFGPTIWRKQGKETKYALRLIPLGGFVNMEGEEEHSENEGSFSKVSIPKRIAIVAAGGLVNIVFALIIYFILIICIKNDVSYAFSATGRFAFSIIDSLKMLFTGNVSIDQMVGPVGIGEIVAKTTGFAEFVYILAVVSISLGFTNLLPFPPLDGGKIVILLIEAIRRKPMSEKLEISIQMAGFALLIGLSILVTYNDVLRIFWNYLVIYYITTKDKNKKQFKTIRGKNGRTKNCKTSI